MQTFPPLFLAHVQGDVTRLTQCWMIERLDGVVIRSTTHDRDVVLELDSSELFGIGGTYSASRGISGSSIRGAADLSVTNLEVSGPLTQNVFLGDDISGADLEAGLYDKAQVIVFTCRYDLPDQGQKILVRGTLGNIRRNSDNAFTCEVRSLGQALAQVQGRSYGLLCDAQLGDARCGLNIEDYTVAGIVTGVTSRRVFGALLDPGSTDMADGYFDGGLLTFDTGANAGYSQEVASYSDVSGFELFEAFPHDIEEDDAFRVVAGDNKELNITVLDGQTEPPSIENGRVTGDCAVKFNNAVNHRGFVNKPGPDTIVRLRTPASPKASSGGGK